MFLTNKNLNLLGKLLPALVIGLGCGGGKKTAAPQLEFKILHPYTAQETNSIVIPGASAAKLSVKLDNLGEPFQSTIPFGQITPAPDSIEVHYQKKTNYQVMVSIFADDGALLAAGPLAWTHDFVVPPKPIVAFAKEAISDPNTLLLFASNHGPLTREVWVSGDLGGPYPREGSFLEFPADGRLPIALSPGDGVKQVSVKTRNAFGIESETVTVKTLLKTEKPLNCDALVASTLIPTERLRLKLLGQDSQPLFFGVQGDTADPISFVPFSPGQIHEIKLSDGAGEKKITVLVRDPADNFCLRKNMVLSVDPNAKEASLRVAGNPAFTLESEVDLELNINDFPDAPLEMSLSGALANRQTQWQPFQPKFKTILSPGEGEKVVTVNVRSLGENKVKFSAQTAIFYRPYVYLKQGLQGKTLVLSDFFRIVSLDITGCAEGGPGLKPVLNLTCTPQGQPISVTYRFDDETTMLATP